MILSKLSREKKNIEDKKLDKQTDTCRPLNSATLEQKKKQSKQKQTITSNCSSLPSAFRLDPDLIESDNHLRIKLN